MILFINSKPRPLALYVFSSNQSNIDKVVRETSSGGVCVNDVILHLGVPELPFGGVGASGMGGYHGEASFHTFSHKKSVMRRHLWLDNPLRYPPYTEKKFNLIKKILNLLG
jgi:aldehyde dehydrogenase (NAD+)